MVVLQPASAVEGGAQSRRASVEGEVDRILGVEGAGQGQKPQGAEGPALQALGAVAVERCA